MLFSLLLQTAPVNADSDWLKAAVIALWIIAVAAICYVIAFLVGAARRNVP